MGKYVVRVLAAVASVAALFGGGAYALASASAPAVSRAEHAYFGCVKTAGYPARALFDVSTHTISCPEHSFQIEWNQDQRGRLTAQASLGAGSIPTQLKQIGGTILHGHATDLLQVWLPAGTYLVNASALFSRTVDAGSGPDTYGYLALWTGATPASTFDSFSQGAGTFTTGPLSRKVGGTLPGIDVIDSSASGSHILVVPHGGETLNLSVFAYNEDESGGPYAGCVGSGCTAGDLTQAGSVVVTSADLSAVRVG